MNVSRASRTFLGPAVLLALVLALVIAGPAAAMMGDGSTAGHGGQMMEPGGTIPGGTPPAGSTPGGMMPGDPTDGGTMPGMDGGGHDHMFPDVTPGEWYEPYAEQMVGHGFMRGYADGSFGGYDPMTRGQFAAVMASMMGLESGNGSAFVDMHGFWGADMVGAMVEAGIVHGYPDGTFHPYDTVTRAQMVAMMDRAWEHMHGEWSPTAEDMAAVHEQLHDIGGMWAEQHIAHMYGMGVVHGDESGQFRPWEATNRAQASAMMWRWYELSLGS